MKKLDDYEEFTPRQIRERLHFLLVQEAIKYDIFPSFLEKTLINLIFANTVYKESYLGSDQGLPLVCQRMLKKVENWESVALRQPGQVPELMFSNPMAWQQIVEIIKICANTNQCEFYLI